MICCTVNQTHPRRHSTSCRYWQRRPLWRVLLAAVGLGIILAVAVPAQATTDSTALLRVEGTRSRGFLAWYDNGQNVAYPSQRRAQYLCNNEHGVNTVAAAECRASWREFYGVLVEVRDSAERPDFWPDFWPIPPAPALTP